MLMPLTKSALTHLVSVAWTHNPYPSPSLWKTGDPPLFSLKTKELKKAEGPKMAQKPAQKQHFSIKNCHFSTKNSPNPAFFAASLFHCFSVHCPLFTEH
jgi:hypothetical protein